MGFDSFGLSSHLIEAIADQHYLDPYPIQREVIPQVLKGRDVLGIAQTGSGKTASFVLPLLENLHKSTVSKNRHVKILVLVPTRELAVQVNEVFKLFASYFTQRIKTMAVFGGVSINPQMIQLQNVEILIATPGRLIELVSSKAVHLSEVQTLVLDEADKMLNLGFKDEMRKILALLPLVRQNLLFSATLSDDVKNITDVILINPVVIKIEEEKNNFELIQQSAYSVKDERKGPLLRYLIKQKNMDQVLVFTSSVFKADSVVDKLCKNGIDAMAMHSKKSQGARTEALSLFKRGKLKVLVATDIMSRGIDIKFLPFVLNYELPRSPKDYVHRIGRTGRAESAGEAISLISPDEEHHFKVIQKKMGKQVPVIDSESLDLKGY